MSYEVFGAKRKLDLKKLQEGEEIIKSLIQVSRGVIEIALIVGEDGLPVIHYSPQGIDVDPLSASTTALIGALNAALSLLGITGYSRVDVRMEDNSHLILKPLPRSENILVIKTSPNPNLGLIYYLIDKYSQKISDILQLSLIHI